MCDSCGQQSAYRLTNTRFRYLAAGLLSTAPLVFGSATAWAEESIVLDLVRHGESAANAAGVLDTLAPGTGLTPTGEAQATAIADLLKAAGPYAGIYAGELIRTQETAAYLADMPGMPATQILPGLNEIPAGIFNGSPELSLGGLLYYLGPVAWVLGFPLVPDLGDPSVNGVTFDEQFSGAVQTIFDQTAGHGPLTDVAFSSEGAMATWTMMNVNNPDFSVVLQQLLTTGQLVPNAGQIVVEGSPGDWTLISYDGVPVPQDPGLPTDLFVDFRNLIEAPQFAAYDIWQALLTGDPTTIANAIQSGVGEVGTATVHFPLAVTQQLVDAVGGSGLGGLSTDLTNLLPMSATDLPAALSGELDTILGSGLGGLSTDLTNLLPMSATDLPAALSGELGTILGSGLGGLSTDLTNLLPTIGTDLSGLLPGELGAMVLNVLTSL